MSDYDFEKFAKWDREMELKSDRGQGQPLYWINCDKCGAKAPEGLMVAHMIDCVVVREGQPQQEPSVDNEGNYVATIGASGRNAIRRSMGPLEPEQGQEQASRATIEVQCPNPLCAATGTASLIPVQDQGKWYMRVTDWEIWHVYGCSAYKVEP